ncbi:hypothetical protein ACW0JT_19215 [Arthrobacter sp. SA17]
MSEELLKLIQTWSPLGIAVLTGSLALLGSWFGAKLANRSGQKQWSRNKKQEAYAEFIGHMRITKQESLPAVFEMVRDTPTADLDLEAEAERLRAYWQLELVSNNAVAEVARELLNDLSIYRRMLNNSLGLLKTYMARVANTMPFDSEGKRTELAQNLHELVHEERQSVILQLGFEAVRKRTQWLVQLMRDDLQMTTKEPFPLCDGAELKRLAAEHDNYRNALLIEDS